jgi:hypothetical protein
LNWGVPLKSQILTILWLLLGQHPQISDKPWFIMKSAINQL